MKRFGILFTVLAAFFLSGLASAEEIDLGATARAYIAAVEGTNQEDVSDADRDTLFDFYAEDVSFIHVKFGRTIGPRDVLRAQSENFAGWNRNVTLNIENLIVGSNVAIVEVTRSGEQKTMEGEWKPSNFTFVMVLEFKDGKIARVLNYAP